MRHLKIRQLLLIALISCVPFVVKFVPASPQPVPESIASPLLGQGERKGSAPADMIDEKAKAIYDAGVAAAQKLKSLEVIAQMKMGDLDPSMLPPTASHRCCLAKPSSSARRRCQTTPPVTRSISP